MERNEAYKILGVAVGTSKEDCKKAFHILAHKYHPDKNFGQDAMFKKINSAYQIILKIVDEPIIRMNYGFASNSNVNDLFNQAMNKMNEYYAQQQAQQQQSSGNTIHRYNPTTGGWTIFSS